eukprot:GHUV01011128.1.p1 GENE.GHUV01011128.1~~GHUV01011128.1.p1  ORF type:complete len:300 (+),score=86.90 GHUV01011128.1:284-1183(+)
MEVTRLAASVFLAAFISVKSFRKGSLTAAGAAGAFGVGVVHMSSGWTFGTVLIAFFLTSSKFTRLKQERKAELDESFKVGGQRRLKQVLCNSLGGGVAAVLAAAPTLLGQSGSGTTLQLLAWTAFLGHYACCCADTWASELGMLSSRPPRLITTLRRVPPGVNGAVSPQGLMASAAGGLCMGAMLWLTGSATGELQHLSRLISSITSRSAMCGTDGCNQGVFWLAIGLCAGLGGSLVDSLLGATVQYSGYCHKSHKVVSAAGPHVQHISGVTLLSNEAVNAAAAAVSSMATALAVRWML